MILTGLSHMLWTPLAVDWSGLTQPSLSCIHSHEVSLARTCSHAGTKGARAGD